MQLQPDTASDVVLACVALHNYLRHKICNNVCVDDATSILNDITPVTAIDSVSHEPRSTGGGYNVQAKLVRDKLANYFVGPGQIACQWKHGNVK